MEAKFRQYWAAPRNRTLLLLFIGLLLLCFSGIILPKAQMDSIASGASSSTVLAPKTVPTAAKAKEVVQVIGAHQQVGLKDPFIAPLSAAPPAYAQKIAAGDSVSLVPAEGAKLSGKKTLQKPSVPLPKLTGIININNQKIALLEYREESKQCVVDEKIGPYQVAQVHRNVTLVGPEGTIILEVGQ